MEQQEPSCLHVWPRRDRGQHKTQRNGSRAGRALTSVSLFSSFGNRSMTSDLPAVLPAAVRASTAESAPASLFNLSQYNSHGDWLLRHSPGTVPMTIIPHDYSPSPPEHSRAGKRKKRKPWLTSVSLFSSLGNRSKTPDLAPGA